MNNSGDNKRKYHGVKGLSQALNNVTKPIFRRRGFAENKILTDWNLIVGEAIGSCSAPRKLDFYRDKKNDGVLHVEVYDSGLAMELSYMEPVILEKIASYFGYRAVGRLKLIQKPGGGESQNKIPVYVTPPVLQESKRAMFDQLIGDIEDEDMKKALASLGTSVFAE